MIRHGVVIVTPHYVTESGPRSQGGARRWSTSGPGSTRAPRSTERLGMPTLVLNDAEVHGAGVVTGVGLELVLTLGTGLGLRALRRRRGSPRTSSCRRRPVRWGLSYDTYIGDKERKRLGPAFWSRRVRRVVDALRPVFVWDRLYVGGGNARVITPGDDRRARATTS